MNDETNKHKNWTYKTNEPKQNKREGLDIEKQSVFEGVSSATNSEQLH